MPGAGIMVNFTAVEPPFNVNRFSSANHSDVFSWMVTDSRGKTQTFPTFDFKDHPNLHVRMCTPPSHDGASSPARPSPIKASYWLPSSLNCKTPRGWASY